MGALPELPVDATLADLRGLKPAVTIDIHISAGMGGGKEQEAPNRVLERPKHVSSTLDRPPPAGRSRVLRVRPWFPSPSTLTPRTSSPSSSSTSATRPPPSRSSRQPAKPFGAVLASANGETLVYEAGTTRRGARAASRPRWRWVRSRDWRCGERAWRESGEGGLDGCIYAPKRTPSMHRQRISHQLWGDAVMHFAGALSLDGAELRHGGDPASEGAREAFETRSDLYGSATATRHPCPQTSIACP